QRLARQDSYRQSAFDGTHATIQREFTHGYQVNQASAFSEVAIRPEDAKRDGQIEARALFAHVGRRKIDGRFLKGKKESAVTDRGTNPFARFAYGGIRQ